MRPIDRFLIGALATGIWLLLAVELIQHRPAFAQDRSIANETTEPAEPTKEGLIVNATEIIGLDAYIETVLRQRQLNPRSIAGLDQHIRSVVRRCRVNGGTTGNRISNASITC